MKYLKKCGAPFCALSLSVIVSPCLFAQDVGLYAGLNAGVGRADFTKLTVVPAGPSGGFSQVEVPGTEKDRTLKALIGYSFNQYFAVEGSYTDFGKYEFITRIPASAIPPNGGTLTGDATVEGFAIDLVGTLPLGNNFSLLGRVGVNYLRYEQDFIKAGPMAGLFRDISERKSNAKFGVGLQYAPNDRWAFRAELETHYLEEKLVVDENLNTATIGVTYRFGL